VLSRLVRGNHVVAVWHVADAGLCRRL